VNILNIKEYAVKEKDFACGCTGKIKQGVRKISCHPFFV
jgi:hypothetical protein